MVTEVAVLPPGCNVRSTGNIAAPVEVPKPTKFEVFFPSDKPDCPSLDNTAAKVAVIFFALLAAGCIVGSLPAAIAFSLAFNPFFLFLLGLSVVGVGFCGIARSIERAYVT